MLLQSTQLFKLEPGGLVSTGEAAHPAVTSMGTWETNAQLFLSHLVGSATSPHETWTVLLWVTIPAPGGFVCTRPKRLSGLQACQCWFTG